MSTYLRNCASARLVFAAGLGLAAGVVSASDFGRLSRSLGTGMTDTAVRAQLGDPDYVETTEVLIELTIWRYQSDDGSCELEIGFIAGRQFRKYLMLMLDEESSCEITIRRTQKKLKAPHASSTTFFVASGN